MQKPTYNLILTCLSKIPGPVIKDVVSNSIKEINYSDEEGLIKFTGIMTNEASVKYLMQKLKKKYDHLDAIYYIASEIVSQEATFINKEEKFSLKQSHAKFFEERIYQYCEEEESEPIDFKGLENPISNNPDANELINLSAKIANDIIELKDEHKDKEFHLFIDANGGFRDFVTVVVAILRTLKDEDIEIDQIIGTNLSGSEGSVIDKTAAFQIYDLYSGIYEFINYGRSKTIETYFNECNIEQTSAMEEVISSINQMSDAFTLCRPSKMLRMTKNLKKTLDNYKKEENTSEVFDFLCRKINKEYQYIFASFESGSVEDFQTIRQMILYCLKHKLLQQALTIYSELIPDILYDQIIYPSNEIRQHFETSYNNQKKKPYSKGYTFIQQYMMIKSSKNDRNLKLLDIYIDKTNDDDFQTKTIEGKKKTFKKLLNKNFINSKYREEEIINIMYNYWIIKDERNYSNHADKKDNSSVNFNNVEKASDFMIKAINQIKDLLEEKHL